MTTERADLLVIGASAAGLKCAARFRRLRPEARILVLDAAKDISVGACGLPYVVSGDIDDPEDLRKTAFDVLRDESFFASYKDIEVRTGVRAESIDIEAGTVHAATGDGTVTFSYGELLLATGAAPKVPSGMPAFSDRVRAVKAMDDARGIRGLLQTGQIEEVGIIGAGFIGCEMAEAFGSMWGCSVTLLEAADQVLPGMLDPDMAAIVESELRQQSVDVRTGTLVDRVEQSEGVVIHPRGAAPIEVDLVVVAIGVAPQVALAKAAGIEVGEAGGIVVDQHMRTNAPHVYAAGDCVECTSAVTGKAKMYALGSLANRQGRVAADHMAGRGSKFGPVAGSMIVKAFDLNASATGLTQGEAARMGKDVACVWGTFGDRAHYYPEERRVFAKMVFERGTGRVIGLQLVGRGDVARLVDVLSTVLLRGGTVDDLLDLEFAYAPPFAGALDPLHHLGAMAMAQQRDGVEPVGPTEDWGTSTCVDVRTPEEAQAAPWAGEAVHVPMGEVRRRVSELPAGDVVVVCEKGPRSLEVARWLGGLRDGSVRYLAGGRSLRQRDLG
jgi:NADPH-dependent 2,4-dienoyl-CoA reductase/sulfur reductase-like enzyme